MSVAEETRQQSAQGIRFLARRTLPTKRSARATQPRSTRTGLAPKKKKKRASASETATGFFSMIRQRGVVKMIRTPGASGRTIAIDDAAALGASFSSAK